MLITFIYVGVEYEDLGTLGRRVCDEAVMSDVWVMSAVGDSVCGGVCGNASQQTEYRSF